MRSYRSLKALEHFVRSCFPQRIIVADFEDGLTIVDPSQVDEFDMQRHVEVGHGDRIRLIASGVERLAS